MKRRKTRYVAGLFFAAFVALVALTCRVTFIPDEKPEASVNEAGETVVAEKLTAMERYSAEIWDEKIIPAIHERAVPIETFVANVTGDLNAAGEKYGNRANETSPWSFCVRGKAVVLEIENADKPNKTNLLLDVAPFDGQADCKMHFGKVFPSNTKNAIRDGVGFLKLDDFANQVEFADLTTAFNNKIKEEIILRHAADEYLGRTVSFFGCVSLQDAALDSLAIIPVELNAVEE